METEEAHYRCVAKHLPVQRGNVLLDAIPSVGEHGRNGGGCRPVRQPAHRLQTHGPVGEELCNPMTRGHERSSPQSIANPVAGARTPAPFSLSRGQAHDAPERRASLRRPKPRQAGVTLTMDRACEGDEIRRLAEALGFNPVVPRRLKGFLTSGRAPLRRRKSDTIFDSLSPGSRTIPPDSACSWERPRLLPLHTRFRRQR